MLCRIFLAKIAQRGSNVIRSHDKALEWVRRNTIAEQGIVVSSKQRCPYLEVTGYMIPTLFDAGEHLLAEQYAEFLSWVQRPNGSFVGPNGREYVFDSGQALRGLIRACQHDARFRPFALKAADYVASQIEKDGQMHSPYGKEIPEQVHVFVLPPLLLAGIVFDKPEYLEKAKKALMFYKNFPHVLDDSHLTHFLAYTVDGFVDAGETEFVRSFVRKIFSRQRKDGAIPAYPDVIWTCSPGLAQLAIVGYKLGMHREADRAVDRLCRLQNPSGGFYGSYGFGADYFPREELSWASKFFLDAVQLKTKLVRDRNLYASFPGYGHVEQPVDRNHKLGSPILAQTDARESSVLGMKGWYDAIVGRESAVDLANRIRNSQFPVWCKPLLDHTSPGASTLELGSGTGQLSAILGIYGRVPHLLDYSKGCIQFGKRLFQELELEGYFYRADIVKGIPMRERSVDWVWSSGVLEHLSDEHIVAVLAESARVCTRGVMSLVPNANSIFYRIGKFLKEKNRTWPYGRERPMFTMKNYFEAVGLRSIEEYSVGVYHSLEFWGSDKTEIKSFYDSLALRELQSLNQGYLLFTCGKR